MRTILEFEDIQASFSLLSRLLGVKGRQAIQYSPTVVPTVETQDLVLQSQSETLLAQTDITAAAGNVAGSVYTQFSVPDGESWRVLDGLISTDVLDADQAGAAGLFGLINDAPLTAGIPNGALGTSLQLLGVASQISVQIMFPVQPAAPWIRPGGAIGFMLRAPWTLGVAAAIRINTRIRIARLKA